MVDNIVKEHFDRIAKNYRQKIASHVRKHLLEKWWQLVSFRFTGNPYVLDVGCGDGTIVKYLGSRGVNAIGIDASTELLNVGKNRYPDLETYIVEGDACALDFEDETFEIALMTGFLHHLYLKVDQQL